MNKQGTVKKYIIPNYWVLIVGLGGFILGPTLISVGGEKFNGVASTILMLTMIPCFVGLFRILPGLIRTSGTIKRLKKAGQLETAEAELSSGNVTEMCKRKAACTEHFLFARRGAWACAYTDILWTYKYKFTQRLLFIPIYTWESVIVETKKAKLSVNLGGKDKNNELAELIKMIYQHNPNVLVGFTEENKKAYKAMMKAK